MSIELRPAPSFGHKLPIRFSQNIMPRRISYKMTRQAALILQLTSIRQEAASPVHFLQTWIWPVNDRFQVTFSEKA